MPAYPHIRLDFYGGPIVVSVGPNRTTILEAIAKYGSIVGAAQATGITYRQTWNVVKKLNKEFRAPLIVVQHGGANGGAKLTELGIAVVERYRAMERDARAAMEPHLLVFDDLLGYDRRKSYPPLPSCELQSHSSHPKE